MSKKLLIILVFVMSGAVFTAVSASVINSSDNIKSDIIGMVNGIGGELSELGISSTTEPGQTGGTGGVACVDIDVELSDTLVWDSPYGGGIGEGYIELTNCGDEAAGIQIGISISVNISYLIDTTFILPPFTVWLGAGEILQHQYNFSVPQIDGEVTVCALSSTDGVEDSDCATTVITGSGSIGIPYQSHGLLIAGTDCILFAPAGDSVHAFILENYGNFGVGDTVVVNGYLVWGCDTNCPEAVGCINDNSIDSATDPGAPFESCGILMLVDTCLLFVPTSGNDGPYNPNDTGWQMIITLENYGNCQAGDSVFVSGTLMMEGSLDCPLAVGNLAENTIEPCNQWPPSPFYGCGLLIEGTECLLFSPFADSTNLFVLDNYGSYEAGDIVLVDGFQVIECINVCMDGSGCIVDNSIDSCGNDNPPVPFEGCGVISIVNDCIFYSPVNADSINFALNNHYGYGDGDTVFIHALLDIYCDDDCSTYGCLDIIDISDCDSSGNTNPYEACGVLLETQFCLVFAPLNDYYTRLLLDNYGGYGPGDTVYVNGSLSGQCQNSCGDSVICLLDNTIGECNLIPPDSLYFQGCGTLNEYSGCLRFSPYLEYVPTTTLSNYGTFVAGDEVYVSGIIYLNCDTSCGNQTLACMDNNVIQFCDTMPPDSTYYSGSGYLADDTGCVRFFPHLNEIPPAVLTNYGTFTEGDEVYVSGFLDYDCADPCAYGPYICLDNDTIISYNQQNDTYLGCGILSNVDNCLLFLPLTPDTMWYARFAQVGPFILDNYGSFVEGDTVYVNGELNPYCTTGCVDIGGCIYENTIEQCQNDPTDSTFSGCGVLVEDSLGCVRFYPEGGLFSPLLLTNYSVFGPGDSVMIEGVIDLLYNCDCAGIMQPCMDNSFIVPCGADSAPAPIQLDENLNIQIYPNPFNPTATISFNIPTTARVNLKIYNILGQEIETLINDENIQGQRSLKWNGRAYGSGVYFYRLESGSTIRTGKMVLTK